MKIYQNSNSTYRSANFGDIVIIKRISDNTIMPMQIYYANKVEIKYLPGLCGAYTQTNSIISYTAELPDDNNGIIAASEFSPFGRNIIGKKVGERFVVYLPTGDEEEYTIISIKDKTCVNGQSA